MTFLLLFWEFFKTGLFAIGGGMATVPFLQDMSVKTGWFTSGQLADLIAVSESTPGPLGVNMATYVGYTTGSGVMGVGGGLLGAVAATLGLVTPSIIIILIIAYFMEKFRESRLVKNTMYGLRPASVALISAAGVEIMLFAIFGVENIYEITKAHVSLKSLVLAVLIYVLTTKVKKLKKLHPIWFIGLAALFGMVFGMAA